MRQAPTDMVGSDGVRGANGKKKAMRPPRLMLALFLMSLTLLLVGRVTDVYSGQLVDTDSYSWANRVIDLREDGAWFDDTIEEIEPAGLKQHWSRPFDSVLISVPTLASPFASFEDALLTWAIFLPVLLGLATVIAMWRWFGGLLSGEGCMALAIMVPLNAAIIGGFQAGRADHQTLIALFAVVVVGMAATILVPARGFSMNGVAVGLVASLAIWVAMETMLYVGAIILTLGIRWVFGLRGMEGLVSFLVGLTIGTMLAIVLENGLRRVGGVDLDELSIVFVLFFGLAAVIAHLLVRSHDVGPLGRLIRSGVGGGAVVVVMLAIFPQIADGPLGTVDPFYDETRLQNIAEIQPIVSGSLLFSAGRFAQWLGFLPLAIVGFVRAANIGTLRSRPEWQLLLSGSIVYVPLSLTQVRWSTTAAVFLAVPAAFGVQSILTTFLGTDRTSHHVGRSLVLFTAATWWIPVSVAAASSEPPVEAMCDPRMLIELLQESNAEEGDLLVVMTDYGPRLLFETELHVLSIPNHRHQPGFRATYDIMNAEGEEEQKRLLYESDAEYVAICSSETEADFFNSGPDGLREQLIDGTGPSWLSAVVSAVPRSNQTEDAPAFLLFEVAKSELD